MEINEETEEEAALGQKITRARTTKCEGCLMHLFGKYATGSVDAEALRERCQAEVMQLRQSGLNEKAQVHPAVYKRLQNALIMAKHQ